MTRLAATAIAILAATTACSRPSGPSAPAAPANPLEGGTLVFSDDFDGSGIGEQWRAEGDSWSIEEGWLAVRDARNDALWLQFPLPDDVRVEFAAKSLTEVGDLKFEIFGDGRNHQSGYVGIFGGWNNTLNIIARLDEHGADRLVGQDGVHVEPNRVYRMAVVRTDNRMRWFVDGQPFLTFDDSAPLVGDDHDHFGFNDWAAPVRFDEVRVYDLSAQP